MRIISGVLRTPLLVACFRTQRYSYLFTTYVYVPVFKLSALHSKILYERLELAQKLSCDPKPITIYPLPITVSGSARHSTPSPSAHILQLDPQDRPAAMYVNLLFHRLQLRYELFLQNALKLLEKKMDPNEFKEECRDMLGVQSYILFPIHSVLAALGTYLCLPSLLTSLGRQIRKVIHHPPTLQILHAFKYELHRCKHNNKHEHEQYLHNVLPYFVGKRCYHVKYNVLNGMHSSLSFSSFGSSKYLTSVQAA